VIGITVGGASRKTFGCTERQSTLLMARSRCAGGMKKEPDSLSGSILYATSLLW